MFKKRNLLCLGNPNDINLASGTPYYIAKYGRELGLISDPLELDLPKNKIQKYIWNAKQYLKTGKYGGYQYSEKFLSNFQNIFVEQAKKTSEKIYILSHHPFLPLYPWPDNFFVDFYIDATNKQIFNNYGTGSLIDEKFISKIILRERESYKSANKIICMCKWAEDSVINDYGIDPNKVHTVVGGPNLDEKFIRENVQQYCPKEPTESNPLVIGFIGKDWERKGGLFALEIVKELNNRGIFSILKVIGVPKKNIPNNNFIENLGFIDKNKDFNKFAKEIISMHFSALFSINEASPRSNLESLRLGVPILSHDIGGIRSTFIKDSYGHLFKPFPSAKKVANWIVSQIKPYTTYSSKRKSLQKFSKEINWEKEILKIKEILGND